jgi:hypothetical protein
MGVYRISAAAGVMVLSAVAMMTIGIAALYGAGPAMVDALCSRDSAQDAGDPVAIIADESVVDEFDED